MDQTDAFRNLYFNVRRRSLPARLIAVVVAFVIFTVMWWVIPHEALYWLLALTVAIAVWVASYGWREAISNLISFLQRLEQL